MLLKKKRNKTPKENKNVSYAEEYMCVGMTLGMVLGIGTENMAVFMSLGTSVGWALGELMDRRATRKKKEEEVND